MGRVFAKPDSATSIELFQDETLADILKRPECKGLTYEELALYNWGTKADIEVNRALIELVGCSKPDKDPRLSKLDDSLGTGKSILIPQPFKRDFTKDQLDKLHVLKLRKVLHVPAVSITSLTRWFHPEKSESCDIKYRLEGSIAAADQLDFEVYPARYFEVNKGGELVPAHPDADASREYIFRKPIIGAKPEDGELTQSWDGKSQATQGILKGNSSINHACAPYMVQLRYYKKDDEKDTSKARILLDPFYPTWKLPANQKGKPLELDPQSLVVKWKIKDDQDKLKIGQLIVWKNWGKQNVAAEVVCRVVLNRDALRAGQYDLLNGAAQKWDRTQIQREDMPYMVQLQAHSDVTVEKGLALAVMHTAVKPLVYDKVQFIGFEIRPDCTYDGASPPNPTGYLGLDKDADDLAERCKIMKSAIQAARTNANILEDEHVLKVFMAPEFFFRGSHGGYDMAEKKDDPGLAPGILKLLREETDQFKYADWLFVFGTAIGYIRHEESPGNKLRFEGMVQGQILEFGKSPTGERNSLVRVKIPNASRVSHAMTNVKEAWKLQQGNLREDITACALESNETCWLTLKPNKKDFKQAPDTILLLDPTAWVVHTDPPNKSITVNSKVCSRIRLTVGRPSPAFTWTVEQQGSVASIDKVEPDPSGYKLTFKANPATPIRADWPITLLEPISTEVFNLALVQKGWPAPLPSDHNLKAAVVYKEHVSSIDFWEEHEKKWGDPTGKGRKIHIHGDSDRPMLPSAGASDDVLGKDLLSEHPSTPEWEKKGTGMKHTVGSEINLSGIGGGSVFTIDGITFGLEVCLDHAYSRLHKFYNSPQLKDGDPAVQVHLIPSWGMSIGHGAICCLNNGLVFNVDGERFGRNASSVARVFDEQYSCDIHPGQNNGPTFEYCPECEEPFLCPGCNQFFWKTPGPPSHCFGSVPIRYYFCSGRDHHSGPFPPSANGKCPTCQRLVVGAMQPIGSEIKRKIPELDIAAANISTFYKGNGKVVLYEAAALPAASTAP
jgi:hypothetical protein